MHSSTSYKNDNKNRVPLLPSTDIIPASLDVAPLLREVFQSEMSVDVSVYKNKLNEEFFQKYEETCQEITETEKEMMIIDAKHLINSHGSHTSSWLNRRLLKREQSDNKISKNRLDRFNLIDTNRVFKTYEKFLFFPDDNYDTITSLGTINSAKSTLDNLCLSNRQLLPSQYHSRGLIKFKKIKPQKQYSKPFDELWRFSRYTNPLILPSKSVFQAVPNEIIFTNCEVGYEYSAHLVIQNCGTVSKRFLISPIKGKSAFTYEFASPQQQKNILAPGMSTKLLVKYVCYVAKNYYEKINIHVKDCSDLVVQLKVIRETPTLKVLPPLSSSISYNRYYILTHSIECGSALAGNTNVINLVLYNQGSSVKFIIITEEDWASQEIKSINRRNELHVSMFTVYPAYFHVDKKSTFTLTVVFTPQAFGLFTEKLFILCDNSTMAQLDLLGEGVLFEYRFIKFLDMEKTYSAAIDDDPSAKLFLPLKTMTCSSVEKNKFCIYSESHLPFNFHWEFSNINVPNQIHNQLDHSCISISPSKGLLLPFTEIKCIVTVKLKKMHPGSYKTILSLFVENLGEDKVPYELKEKLIQDDEHGGMKLEAGRIEVRLECKRAEIVVVPYVVHFNGEPILCTSPTLPQADIEIQNLSVSGVECYWENPENNLIKIIIKPLKFKIPVNEKRVCQISIDAPVSQEINQLIRCIVNKGESCADVLVKGSFTLGRFSASTQINDFHIVQKNSPANADMTFTNLSYCQPFWRCNELLFVGDKATTSHNNQSKENRLKHGHNFGPRNSHVDEIKIRLGGLKPEEKICFGREGILNDMNEIVKLNYKLQTNEEKIWCSLLILDLGNTNEYIAIIADIQDPLLSLSHCWMPILDDMILHEPVTVSLKLRNHTALSMPFAWTHPIGHQRHDFLVKIKPSEGILLPRQSIEIYFRLFPLKLGVKTCILFPCFFQRMRDPLLCLVTGLVKPLTVYLQWKCGESQHSVTWPKFNIDNNKVDWDTFKQTNNLQYADTLSPFNYFKIVRKSSQMSFCLLREEPARESKPKVINTDGLESSEELKVREIRYNIEEEEEGEVQELSENSTSSSLYDIYQNYPIISGKYVLNEPHNEINDEENSIEDNNKEETEEKGKEDESGNIDETSVGNRIYFELNENLKTIDEEKKLKNRQQSFGSLKASSNKSLSSGGTDNTRKSVMKKITDYTFKIIDYPDSKDYLGHNVCDTGVESIIFDNIPCWKAVKEVISLTCYAPLRTFLSVSVKNYRECYPVKKFSISRLMEKPKDDWRERIPDGQGLIIVPEPKLHELNGHDTIGVTMWVYANTWGTYTDTLTVLVGYLPPLHIHIIVNVCDNPIVFPSLFEPIIRMGCLPYKGNNRSYNLRVRNNCAVDVLVKWSFFLTDYHKHKTKTPFNVMLIDIDDVVSTDSEYASDIMKLILTPYYGQRDFKIYSLNKQNLFLKAWCEDIVEIMLNINEVEYANVSLDAVLLGHVYKSPQQQQIRTSHKSVDNSPSGSEIVLCGCDFQRSFVCNDCELIQPVVIDIKASMHISKLILINHTEDSFHFKVLAIDVMKFQGETYQKKQIIKFKNDGPSAITFTVIVQEPFVIKKIETIDTKHIFPGQEEIILKNDEMCELTILLYVTKTYIQEIIQQTPLPLPKTREEALAPPKLYRERKEVKNMCISQEGIKEIFKEMAIEIIFPALRLSVGKIIFGPVYINSTKFEEFYMFTDDPEPVYFEIVDVAGNQEDSVFEFIPKTGYIKSKIPFPIRLYFEPKQPADYKEIFSVRTAVPNHELNFYAVGVGTLNFKDVHYESRL